jgi:hypothetical protein
MGRYYKETGLWKRAFHSELISSAERDACARLTSTLAEIDAQVGDLLSRIPESCRHLTVHDIRHIHQLWDVASTICGEEYAINPLEGFILGVAFLIHDAGLTAAAYPNGVEGLRQTKLYKDTLAIELKRDGGGLEITNQLPSAPSPRQQDDVLFAVLRKLHPERALNLLDETYIHPLTKQNWTLLPVNLLFDVGLITGKIAASHHWDTSQLAREFGEPLSPPADFPWWQVDGLKLACILRCADACAIDERRAPLMSFILTNPRGASRDHWSFQGYLNPAYLPPGQEGLVFQSKSPMTREYMNAWWLAYESISVADRELRDCDRLFKSRTGHGDQAQEIQFAAKRVEGAGDASRLAQLVTVAGWKPIDTTVRISDPLALIERLGGRHLYGNDHTAPIRELVQNAADAVRARRARRGYGPDAKHDAGEIHLSVQKLETGSWVIKVMDDGIGMPESILSGTFLDFGKSLWQSDRIASLYPGLASDPDFKPTGQFGIGFYASFIIGHDVKVFSKPLAGGDDQRKVLHFIDGVRNRAELRDYNLTLDGEWPYEQNTIVEISFKGDNWLSMFAGLSADRDWDRPVYSSERRYWDYFGKTLEKLVFCLDVRVDLTTPFFNRKSANNIEIFDIPSIAFVQEFNRVFGRSENDKISDELIPLIESMNDGQKPRTRGTISTSNFMPSIYHIGGLTVFSGEAGTPYVAKYVTGVHQAVPTTVSRQTIIRASSLDDFKDWAYSQLAKLNNVALDDLQLGTALLSIYEITKDLKDNWFLFDLNNNIIYFRLMDLSLGDKIFIICNRHPLLSKTQIAPYQGILIFTPREFYAKSDEYKYVLELQFGFDSEYSLVELYDKDLTSNPSTAIGQLFAEVRRRGFQPTRSIITTHTIGTYTGPAGGRGKFFNNDVKKDMPIDALGLVVTVCSNNG